MVSVWSVTVLVLIVQLFEFRGVAGNMPSAPHIFPSKAIGDNLPARSGACHGSHSPNP
jgi:hypothetical protein